MDGFLSLSLSATARELCSAMVGSNTLVQMYHLENLKLATEAPCSPGLIPLATPGLHTGGAESHTPTLDRPYRGFVKASPSISGGLA